MRLTQKISLQRKKIMKDMIRNIPDFPKSGIVFKDIFPLLQHSFGEVIDDLSRKIERPNEIDYIVGIESRGFIFAAALAYKLNKGFVPIRKKGKLPPPTFGETVFMEYGETQIEMALGDIGSIKHTKIVLIDDVIATGETLRRAWTLCFRCGYFPQQAIALVNIKKANIGKFNFPVKYLFEYKE